MPKTWTVTLDRAGVGNLLKRGAIPEMTNTAASRIAEGIRTRLPNDGEGDVVVEPYTTDRGAAAVVVRHPRAVGLQAKYGIITSSAAALGIRVKGHSLSSLRKHRRAQANRGAR